MQVAWRKSIAWWVPCTFVAFQCWIFVVLLLCWWQPLQVGDNGKNYVVDNNGKVVVPVSSSDVNLHTPSLVSQIICEIFFWWRYFRCCLNVFDLTLHNLHRLSLVTRIIPSPDWFVGIDSLDLCRNGVFVSSVKVTPIKFYSCSHFHKYLLAFTFFCHFHFH